jgi:ABC-type branched-subunit amino acid transport system ATPase component
VLEAGRVVLRGSASDLRQDSGLRASYLGS